MTYGRICLIITAEINQRGITLSPTLQLLWTQPQQDLSRPISPEIRQRCRAYLDQVTQAFGIPFTDALTNAMDAEHDARVEAAYQQGFLTAFHLWMDSIAEYPMGE